MSNHQSDALIEVLREAAEKGDGKSQFSLGIRYVEGKGVIRNYAEAMRLFRLAAEQGVASAYMALGKMHAEAIGTHQDDVEAVRLLRLAAEHGNATAQLSLAEAYHAGKGVDKDDVQAYAWAGLAARGFFKCGLDAEPLTIREIIYERLTPEQLDEAHVLEQSYQRYVYKHGSGRGAKPAVNKTVEPARDALPQIQKLSPGL